MFFIPETWSSLEEYTKWYKDSKYPIRIPLDAKVYTTEHTFSITVFRHSEFITELYLVKGNTTSPKHYHVASQSPIFLGGTFISRNAKYLEEEPDYVEVGSKDNIDPKLKEHPQAHTILGVLNPKHWHQLISGENGFAFFVCQHWPETDRMSSAVVDWIGEPIGTEHKNLLGR